MLAEGSGEHILNVGGEDDVAIVFVHHQSQTVYHVHHTNDGFKCLRRNVGYKRRTRLMKFCAAKDICIMSLPEVTESYRAFTGGCTRLQVVMYQLQGAYKLRDN